MHPNDLAERCKAAIGRVPRQETTAEVGLILPGRWGKRDTRLLAGRGSPRGQIVSDMGPRGIMVFFNAMDVLAWLAAKGLVIVECRVRREGESS